MTTHTLGPVAARTVETIRAHRAVRRDLSEYVHATIAVEGEARTALAEYDAGLIGAEKLGATLRDIVAICEAAGGVA
jgi:hypothetical protein